MIDDILKRVYASGATKDSKGAHSATFAEIGLASDFRSVQIASLACFSLVRTPSMFAMEHGIVAAQYQSLQCIYILLSCLNTKSANLCRTNSPAIPQMVCITRSSIASRSSLLGPNQTSHRLSIVKFVDSTISLLLFLWTLTKGTGNASSNLKSPATGVDGGCSQCVTDGSKSLVRALNRGKRCLGQGIRRKSCGAE